MSQHRAEVLRAFSTTPSLFRTQLYREKFEVQARANMLWEISQLEAGTFPRDPYDDSGFGSMRERLDSLLDADHDGKVKT